MSTAAVAPHKLARPRSNVRPRDRLIAVLEDATSSVTVLCAGAGFGKSTLLATWADSTERPLAWLNLDRGDNDPVRLVRGLAASLEDTLDLPGLNEAARVARPGTVAQALDEIERRLADADAFVLVLDDVHEVTDTAAVDVLDALIDAIPAGSRVVLSCRSTPPIRTGRRTVAGDLDTIGPLELRLDTEESWAVLDEFREQVDHDLLASLVDRLEGWPAGVQFVALGLRAAQATGAPSPEASATSSDLTDYFQQEFLRSLSPDDLEFLRRTSVLDQLSGDFCDHVLGRDDSAARLRALVVSGNAFVSPNQGSETVHYHPLFGAVLLTQLRSTEPDCESVLRTRAVDWHERRREWAEAVRVAIDGRDCMPASPVIFRSLVPAIGSGEIASIGQWLGHFDMTEVRDDPLLSLAAAWYALFSNQPREMERWLDAAEEVGYDGTLPDGTRDLCTAIAAVRMLAGTGGVRATSDHARTLLDAGGAGGPWRSVASIQFAVTTQLSRPDVDAVPLYEDAEFRTRGFPPAHAVALAHLAIEAVQRRDLATAIGYVDQARAEVRAHGLHHLAQTSLVHCATALVSAHTGALVESSEASQHADTLLDSVDALHSRSQIHHRLVLAEAALVRHDAAEARAQLREAKRRLPFEPDAVVLHEWCERLDRRCVGHHGSGPDIDITPAELRVLEQLATHRTLAEIGRNLYVSRNTVKTHTVSIYRKLAVTGRSEAVARAIELGLVEDVDRAVVNLR